MTLHVLPLALCICKLESPQPIPDEGFWCQSRTGSEVSLVCEDTLVPNDALRTSEGWRALRVAGTLDFSLTGILSRLSCTLAEADISLFALSTFDTDYILVKQNTLADAVYALQNAGHTVESA